MIFGVLNREKIWHQ